MCIRATLLEKNVEEHKLFNYVRPISISEYFNINSIIKKNIEDVGAEIKLVKAELVKLLTDDKISQFWPRRLKLIPICEGFNAFLL